MSMSTVWKILGNEDSKMDKTAFTTSNYSNLQYY